MTMLKHASDCAIYDEREVRPCSCGTCDEAHLRRIAGLEAFARYVLQNSGERTMRDKADEILNAKGGSERGQDGCF